MLGPALPPTAAAPLGSASAAIFAPRLAPASATLVERFAPSTKIQVGKHRVVIERYLSEGGFAHVYLVKLHKPVDGSHVAVLKRVAVPDKEALASMRTEVETMKRLKGHRHIVTYIDSHASALKGGGYEVFLLMEYCAGGGLIDFMNTRLQTRLTEPEILDIFVDVAEGVACMHHLRPPLLHRDLKVENVLISLRDGQRRYKLCDFGSSASVRPAPTSTPDFHALEEDIQRHTTLQYRSPEMIDIYRKQSIDEKSDVWALGVLLYKLCYYTTPFEDKGQLAILNASFRYPSYPPFSDRIKCLIAWMLREHPQARPNIDQVLQEACALQGKKVGVTNMDHERIPAETRLTAATPLHPSVNSSPRVGAFYAQPTPSVHVQAATTIVPMRRGRPQASSSSPRALSSNSHPSPGPGSQGDPFVALDGPSSTATVATSSPDERSSPYPSIEQFDLLHRSGGTLDLDPKPPRETTTRAAHLSQRVTETLADEAFAQATRPASTDQPRPTSPSTSHEASRSQQAQAQPVLNGHPSPTTHAVPAARPTTVSQGSMTSRSPSAINHLDPGRQPDLNHGLASSAPASAPSRTSAGDSSRYPPHPVLTPKPHPSTRGLRAGTPAISRSKSQTSTGAKPASSPRSSTDLKRPPSAASAATAAPLRRRPVSIYVDPNVGPSHHDRRRSGRPDDDVPGERRVAHRPVGHSPPRGETTIASNVDFLRAMEDDEGWRRREKGRNGEWRHTKRASMPSISFANTKKTLLAGKFGDAFRRFENNAGATAPDARDGHHGHTFRHIAMSDPTSDGDDDDGSPAETEDVGAEVRRELERQALAQEERRVEAAAADYRQRFADRAIDPHLGGAMMTTTTTTTPVWSKATSIQDTVRSVLGGHSPPDPDVIASVSGTPPLASDYVRSSHHLFRPWSSSKSATHSRVPSDGDLTRTTPHDDVSSSSAASKATRPSTSRPRAPPKPDQLRSDAAGAPHRARPDPGGPTTTASSSEGWEIDFHQRYPSLSQLEMIETDIQPSSLGLR